MSTSRRARPTRWWFPRTVEEIITLFQVNGIMLYVDPDGNALGYEDVFSKKITMCRTHYQACGLGAEGPVALRRGQAERPEPDVRRLRHPDPVVRGQHRRHQLRGPVHSLTRHTNCVSRWPRTGAGLTQS